MKNQVKSPKFYAMVGVDAALSALALYLAFLVRFDFAIPAIHAAQIKPLLAWVVPVQIVVSIVFGLYRGMWRYTALHDIVRLFQATFVSTLGVAGWILYRHRFEGYSRTVFVMYAIFVFLLAGGMRALIRMYFIRRGKYGTLLPFDFLAARYKKRNTKRVLVVGAGSAGEKIVRDIMGDPVLAYDVVGFLDDDRSKMGRSLHGVPVLGSVDDLKKCVREYEATQVLIAIGKGTPAQMRRIVEACEDSKVDFKILPPMGQIIDGRVSLKDLRDVDYEDLLGRPEVALDSTSIENYLAGRVVLVSGCGGSIGSELCRQIVKFRPGALILLDFSEANLFAIETHLKQDLGYGSVATILGKVQDEQLVDKVLGKYAPEVVFHAAAYKHVPMLESNPWHAVLNNIVGSHRFMRAALKHKVKRFVLVSTDKAVKPANVMGASKRVAELILQSMTGGATTFMAVRFGNVVGSSGSVVPLFREQIRKGGPVTVTHPEVTRYFMTIPEAVQLILQAGALGEGGEIFVLDMGRPIKIANMARDLIRLSGRDPDRDIEIIFTGLRPGEKLLEELITVGEGMSATAHSKILAIRPEAGKATGSAAAAYWEEQLAVLVRLAECYDGAGIKRKLKELIPEYEVQTSTTVL